MTSNRYKKFSNPEEMVYLAVEASPNGMVMTNSDGEIVMVNSASEKLFGYSRQELIGQSIEILVPEQFRFHHPEFRLTYIKESESRPMGHGRDPVSYTHLDVYKRQVLDNRHDSTRRLAQSITANR